MRFQSFWNKPTSVVSTFEWIPFNQRFSMFCTNYFDCNCSEWKVFHYSNEAMLLLQVFLPEMPSVGWLVEKTDIPFYLSENIVWYMWVITKGSKSKKDVVVACKKSLEVRFQSFWNKPTSVVSTFEWIPFNQRFSMLCTNLIVTARNGKLVIIQTKQCCCCMYFCPKCRQQNKDSCVKWIHIKNCFRVILWKIYAV